MKVKVYIFSCVSCVFSKESTRVKLLNLILDSIELLLEENVAFEVKVVLFLPTALLDLAHVVISIAELSAPSTMSQS